MPDTCPQHETGRSPATLSLIIATRNRASQMRRTLSRLDLDDIRASNTEVILVDNASQDDTAVVLEEFRRAAGVPVIVVREGKIGTGNARNAGMNAAAGMYRIFTDDDCYLASGYLSRAYRLFAARDIHWGGGRTLLFDESDAPEAVRTDEEPAVLPPFGLVHPGQFLGANMFFTKEVNARVGGFDPLFGTGTLFASEDLEYVTRCSYAGYAGHYVPELVVYHHHGRKRGSAAIARRMREYYHGIGAVCMRSLLQGRREGFRQLVSQGRRNRTQLLYGLAGGLHYLWARRRRRTSRVRVWVYTVCWNESRMLPHFLRHYHFADRIVVYDHHSTDDSVAIVRRQPNTVLRSLPSRDEIHEADLLAIKNHAYKESRGRADFVIVVDVDELLYHPSLPDLLARYKTEGVTLPRIKGYNMVSECFPTDDEGLLHSVRQGVPDDVAFDGYVNAYGKRCVFNPSVDINFEPGCHGCRPQGPVKQSDAAEIKLLHYKFLGLAYTLERHNAYKQRLSKDMIQQCLWSQYTWSDDRIADLFNALRQQAVQVL